LVFADFSWEASEAKKEPVCSTIQDMGMATCP
jgi:hypothetical protein